MTSKSHKPKEEEATLENCLVPYFEAREAKAREAEAREAEAQRPHPIREAVSNLVCILYFLGCLGVGGYLIVRLVNMPDRAKPCVEAHGVCVSYPHICKARHGHCVRNAARGAFVAHVAVGAVD